MNRIQKQITLGVAVLLASSTLPANAFAYLGGDEVLEQLGLTPQVDQPQQQQAGNSGSGSEQSNQAYKTNQPNVQNQAMHDVSPTAPPEPMADPPKDLKMIGYWVGNIQYKVASADDNLYVVGPQGQVSELPKGTQADNVVVPFDNALVQGMLNSQPVASQESQFRMSQQKNAGSGKFNSQPGLLKPTLMATRTMVVNGKPMVVGGPVICELSQPAQQQTQNQTQQNTAQATAQKTQSKVTQKRTSRTKARVITRKRTRVQVSKATKR